MAAQDFADAEINLRLSPEGKVRLYREMLRTRLFEQHAIGPYCGGKMRGWLALQIGQEAIAAAVRSLMGPHDHSICGIRGIGHALAAGMPMRSIMAELYGRASGAAKGKAGMLGLYSPEHRHWGNHGFAGTQTALAAGLAFALKHRGEPGAVCCFLGDGAMNQGVVHEAFNLTALFDLPVVFIIENNGYAMGSSEARSSATGGSLAQRAEGYGMAWDRINGDHIYEVRAKTWCALERAHRESRPTVVEMSTYRFEGFVIADAMKLTYRTKAEVEDHQLNHDPLRLWQEQLEREGIVTSGPLAAIKREVQDEVKDAMDHAEQSPFPGMEAFTQDIYWEVDNATPGKPQGRHFF